MTTLLFTLLTGMALAAAAAVVVFVVVSLSVTHGGQCSRRPPGPPQTLARNTEHPQTGCQDARGCPSGRRQGPR